MALVGTNAKVVVTVLVIGSALSLLTGTLQDRSGEMICHVQSQGNDKSIMYQVDELVDLMYQVDEA